MTINYQTLKAWIFKDQITPYTHKDCILYALSLGYGQDPMDADELPFVCEHNHHEILKTVPSLFTILGAPGAWATDPATGIDYSRLLHGEHRLTLHGTLPPEGVLRSRTHMARVIDKGMGRGALVITERNIYDEATDHLLASIEHTSFCRADGGFSTGVHDSDVPPAALPATPDTPPDATIRLPTTGNAALLYRLNGDWNPLHASPPLAQRVGFERPILHGLCTYGMATRAIVRTYCHHQPEKLGSMAVRFSAPFYPGETLVIQMWKRDHFVHFRALCTERGSVILNHGLATIHD